MPSATPEEQDGAARRKGEADAWGALGLVISGVLVWGGVGALLSAWLDNRFPTLVGLLVGMAGGLYLVWFRYGRPCPRSSGADRIVLLRPDRRAVEEGHRDHDVARHRGRDVQQPGAR